MKDNQEENKDFSHKFNLSKFEHDLYHDSDNKIEKLIRIKSFSLPDKHKKWKISVDSKIILIIESAKLSKKEKEFLETLEGFQFMLSEVKSGTIVFSDFKSALKLKISKK